MAVRYGWAAVPDPVDTWILVCAGLMAHADGNLEVGEWDFVADLLDDAEGVDLDAWMPVLTDPQALSRRFEALEPPADPKAAEAIAYRAWQVALADGEASEVEASVHQRIADRLGVDAATAEAWRERWSELAARGGEIAVGLAACLAHVDGSLDPAEAVGFDEILERVPVSVARRVELGAYLHAPPDPSDLARRARELPEAERRRIVRCVAPMVRASARGRAEAEALVRFAEDAGLTAEEAWRILERS